jgi:hypothetical protein
MKPSPKKTATELQSTLVAPDYDPGDVSKKEKEKKKGSTDFQHLKKELGQKLRREQPLTPTDLLIDVLTPIMVYFMVVTVVFFILDVRFVLDDFQGISHKPMSAFLILGIVALNRFVAREGAHERDTAKSIMQLTGITVFYTFVVTALDASLNKGYYIGFWMPFIFNLLVVAIVWWVANRLTHECCVDENYKAGDIGILAGTMENFKQSIQPVLKKPSLSGLSEKLFSKHREESPVLLDNEVEAVEPTDLESLKSEPATEVNTYSFAERLNKRHAGVSIFYFAIPVMIIFAVGLPIIRHGGRAYEITGHIYVALFTMAALTLLMLTSLAGLRAYFRQRKVPLPEMIGVYWVALGGFMILIVMLAALNLPTPEMPEFADLGELEERDEFWRAQLEYLRSESDRRGSETARVINQSAYIKYLSLAVMVVCILFAMYASVRLVLIFVGMVGRNRQYYPQWIVRFFDRLDQALQGISDLPSLPKRTLLRIKINPSESYSYKFRNPMKGDSGGGREETEANIAYAYDALCALAYDMGVPRGEHQTPFEFLKKFPIEMKPIFEEAEELTRLYVKSAYSDFELDKKVLDRVRKFWMAFESLRNQYTGSLK